MSSNTTNTNAAIDALTHDNLSIPLRLVGVGLVHTLALYGNEADIEDNEVIPNEESECEVEEEHIEVKKKKKVETSTKRKRNSVEPSGITMFE